MALFDPIASTSRPLPEFQAVILCGHGEDLYPLTAASISNALPKALLPVANKPMVEGVLRWVEQANLTDVLLLAPQSQEHELSSYLRVRRQSSEHTASSLRIDIQCFDDEERWETADILRWAASKFYIRTDFIVLPCDLCIIQASSSELTLQSMLNQHRLGENLLTTLYYERSASNEEKAKDGPPAILTTIDTDDSLLLDQREMADFDDEIEIRSSLLDKFPKALLTINLLPAHVYICSKRLLTLLNAIPALKNLKDDAVPFLCKSQWQEGLLAKVAPDSNLAPLPTSQSLAFSHSTTSRPSGHTKTAQGDAQTTNTSKSKANGLPRPPLRTMSTSASFWENQVDLEAQNQERAYLKDVRCAIRVWKKSDGFCARANTVEAYSEANRVVLPIAAAAAALDRPATQEKTPNAPRQLGTDCVVGPGLNLGDRALVKKSSIGKNVTIGNQAKIVGCIIMEGAIIGEGAKLDNCIVCAYARIGQGATLTKCEVAAKTEVSAGAQGKGEKLVEL